MLPDQKYWLVNFCDFNQHVHLAYFLNAFGNLTFSMDLKDKTVKSLLALVYIQRAQDNMVVSFKVNCFKELCSVAQAHYYLVICKTIQ